METLKLNNANVVELTTDELENIDGGVVAVPWYTALFRFALGAGMAYGLHECTC